jgi:hypothetical protein
MGELFCLAADQASGEMCGLIDTWRLAKKLHVRACYWTITPIKSMPLDGL